MKYAQFCFETNISFSYRLTYTLSEWTQYYYPALKCTKPPQPFTVIVIFYATIALFLDYPFEYVEQFQSLYKIFNIFTVATKFDPSDTASPVYIVEPQGSIDDDSSMARIKIVPP